MKKFISPLRKTRQGPGLEDLPSPPLGKTQADGFGGRNPCSVLYGKPRTTGTSMIAGPLGRPRRSRSTVGLIGYGTRRTGLGPGGSGPKSGWARSGGCRLENGPVKSLVYHTTQSTGLGLILSQLSCLVRGALIN